MESNNYSRIPIHQRIEAGVRMTRRHETLEKVSQIARDMNISRNHLYSLEKKYIGDPTMVDEEREGRPKKVDETMERRILREIKKHPFESSSIIALKVNENLEEEKQIAPSTVRTVALQNGYFARRPIPKPALTPAHVAKRLEFGKKYLYRTSHFWRNVCYMDESMIRLKPTDLRIRVRRKSGERMDRRHVVNRVRYEGGGVMYWGVVSWAGPGPLIYIDETLTGSKYAEILDENIEEVKQSLNLLSLAFIEDHATSHGTHAVLEVKENHSLKNLELSPNSPDLNIIETVWSYWKTRVARRDPETLENLQQIAEEEWRNIPIEYIRSLIRGMPERIKAVVKSKGHYTKY